MSLSFFRRFWRSRSSVGKRPLSRRTRLQMEPLEQRQLLSGFGRANAEIALLSEGVRGITQPANSPPTQSVVAIGGGATTTPGITSTTSPVPGTDPTAGDSRWIVRVYNDVLYRAPQASETDFWVRALQAGATRPQIADLIVTSPESRGNQITTNYRNLLGREPETGVVSWWQGALAAGLSDDALTAKILASNEFYHQHGAADASWVDGLYGVVLGRRADEAGLKTWTTALSAGAPREAVALGVVTSPESRSWTIGDDYGQLLHRPAGQVDMAFWGDAFQNGLTPAGLQTMLVTSQEYMVGQSGIVAGNAKSLRMDRVQTNTGAAVDNGFTNGTSFRLEGRGSAGLSVMALVDGVSTTRGRVAADGSFSTSLSDALSDGRREIAIQGETPFGPKAELNITVDRTAPSIMLGGDQTTEDVSAPITVTINPMDSLGFDGTVHFDVDRNGDGDFNDPGERDSTQSVVGSGSSSVKLDLPPGDYLIQGRIGDLAGNTATSPQFPLRILPSTTSLAEPKPPSEPASRMPLMPPRTLPQPTPPVDPGRGGGGGSPGQGEDQDDQDQSDANSKLVLGRGVVNVAQTAFDLSETAMAIDPTNTDRLFVASNQFSPTAGVFTAYSKDGGKSWTSRVVADGTDGLTTACCDAHASFDEFGNLFLTYLSQTPRSTTVALSTDGGATFRQVGNFPAFDYPNLDAGSGSVWAGYAATAGWTAAGAAVTGLGQVGAFSTFVVPGTLGNGSNISDVAIGPDGQVMGAYIQDSSQPNLAFGLTVDPDGLGPAPFSPSAIVVPTTNMPFFLFTPAQPNRGDGAMPRLAYDRSNSTYRGRAYLMYNTAPQLGSTDTNLFLIYSDDDGTTWSPPVRINDDIGGNASQYLADIAVDQTNGHIVVSWYDQRLDTGSGPDDTDGIPITDNAYFYAVSHDGGKSFRPNVKLSTGPSNTRRNPGPNPNDYGDYTSVAIHKGKIFAAWADNSAAISPQGYYQLVVGSARDTPDALPDDPFETNDTSDKAIPLPALRRSVVTYPLLTINRKATGYPDYDWFRMDSGNGGQFTATINYSVATGDDLHMRVFTLNAFNTLVEIGSSTRNNVTRQSVSVRVSRPHQPILVWVYGYNYATAEYALSVNLR